MEHIYEGSPIPPLPRGTVVTVGTFDGVHRGHERILAETTRLAHEMRCPSVVITFDRHPASVVRPESAPRIITTMQQKFDRFATLGVDIVYAVRFDEARSLTSAPDFFNEIVVGLWRAAAIVAGPGFRFGHRQSGDIALLEELGARENVKVEEVELLRDDVTGEPVSSQSIRDALAAADIVTAARLLGRDPEIEGVVEHGDQRGRTIGFPTANVAAAGDIQLPADGVYAGWYERPDGTLHRSAISIGRRPTFYEENGLLLVEAHLLDFDGDLYDEIGRVRIQEWIRGQLRFSGPDELAAQLKADVARTRELMPE
ncbi:MAG: ribF [Actinomycetia bacterium]|nr:ribF [Actinomycetes bacterium]